MNAAVAQRTTREAARPQVYTEPEGGIDEPADYDPDDRFVPTTLTVTCTAETVRLVAAFAKQRGMTIDCWLRDLVESKVRGRGRLRVVTVDQLASM